MSGDLVHSFSVSSTLTTQRIVACVSGTANTVQYPEAATNLPIGVTIDDVLDTTSSIPVKVTGIAKVFFNDTVTSGQRVAADTSGRGVPFTSPNTTTSATVTAAYVGILIGASVSATGTIAEVLIQPGEERASS